MSTALQPAQLNEGSDFRQEALRVLRRLAEPGACLAIAADMEKGVVVRDTPDGRTVRTAVTGRDTAERMVIEDWITCINAGRVSRYKINEAGQAALKRDLAAREESRSGFAEQHREWDAREFESTSGNRRRRIQYNIAESPVQFLARRKSSDGQPFLDPDLVASAERLREDFELAHMGPRITQNWEKFLTGTDRQAAAGAVSDTGGSEAAKRRVMDALEHLGPGLSDVALRVCCFLEGLESAEKRLGWSARSGKVVLRIALQRLNEYYAKLGAPHMIG